MQSVVIILLLLGTLSFAVKLSLKKLWQWIVWAVLTALATGLSWPIASAQSKTQIADFLQSPTMMADASVLLTLEVGLMVAYCIMAGAEADASVSQKPLRKVGRWLLEAFPGLTVFVAIFAVLTQLMFTLTGTSFALTSWLTAAGVLVLVSALAWVVGMLLPERTLRLELLFVVNLVMGGLGIVATVNGRTAVEGNATVGWMQLLTVVGLCLVGVVAGLAIRKFKSRDREKRGQ